MGARAPQCSADSPIPMPCLVEENVPVFSAGPRGLARPAPEIPSSGSFDRMLRRTSSQKATCTDFVGVAQLRLAGGLTLDPSGPPIAALTLRRPQM